MNEVERDMTALADSLEAAEQRLAQVRAQLNSEGVTVVGSRGQTRPHPLIVTEREITRDLERIRAALDALRVRLRAEQDRRRLDEQLAAANSIARG